MNAQADAREQVKFLVLKSYAESDLNLYRVDVVLLPTGADAESGIQKCRKSAPATPHTPPYRKEMMMNEADKKYYDRLMRIMFREQLCSLHAAACWLSAGKYCFTGNRKKPFQGHTDQPSVTPK